MKRQLSISSAKPNLLVSFSGGETSAYMAQWLWNNRRDQFGEMVFVFANTGQENEETLVFVDKCSQHFGFPIVWVEAVVPEEYGVGTTFKEVDFESASRDGQPFEELIRKHGIPNRNAPICTRELKQTPISKYGKSLGWSEYYTAIGIRIDEADRMNSKYKEKRLIYPLITDNPSTKPKINHWWSQQPFRLELKGYQGNCKWCWKKSLPKLKQIAKENPSAFDFPERMEGQYGNYLHPKRIEKMRAKGKEPVFPIRFFRENRSAKEIKELSLQPFKAPKDDSQDVNFQSTVFDGEDESCEVFSNCGDE